MRALRSGKFIAGLAFTLSVSAISLTAHADSTFLLQLGEYKTEGEARQQWDILKTKHKAELGNLELRVNEVKKSGGEVAYRTQAGAVPSREMAQSLCSKLTDVKCLVVETSMFTPSNVVKDTAAADTAAKETLAPEPQLAATSRIVDENAPADSTMLTLEDTKKDENELPPLIPPSEKAPEAAMAAKPAPEKLMAADSSMGNTSSMEKPADKNAAESTAAPVAAPTPTPVTQRMSFKEALLPWLRDDNLDDKSAETPAEAAPAVKTAIVENNAMVEDKTPVDNKTAAAMAEPMMKAEPAPAMDSNAVPELAPRMLQAPASARAADEAPTQAAVPVAPITSQPVSLTPQTGSDTPAGTVKTAPGSTEVEVSEAIRVPLSTFPEGAAPVPVSKPVGYGGFPSQALPRGNSWVQVGSFADRDAAINFWREASVKNPQAYGSLRIRVISPWQSRYRRSNSTSLRMGPFATQEDVNKLCEMAAAKSMNCSNVTEVGSSGPAYGSAARVRDTSDRNHFQQAHAGARIFYPHGTQPNGLYWVQLGAFQTAEEAQQRFTAMQSVHGDVLGRLQSNISYPVLSSGRDQVYHLRTGPFVKQFSATTLCDTLKSRQIGCIIIEGRQ